MPGDDAAMPGPLRGQAQDAPKSTRVGGFEILGRLGNGGMGTVLKARQVSLDRTVALKILPQRLAKDERYVQRFLREARSAAKLDHPNIVQAIDAGQADGYYYFAMEYVDGSTVRELMREKGRFPEDAALDLIEAVAHALGHAHANGLVHRDVKPENIMVSRDGVVKLADLGLARAVAKADSVTVDGTALGTPHYMAPEQIRGEPDVDIRADLYSLGATLYYMVTGETPFQGPTSAAIIAKHLMDPVPSPKAKNPDLSDHVCGLIAWMMEKDRAKRPQTPAALIEAIRQGGATRTIEHLPLAGEGAHFRQWAPASPPPPACPMPEPARAPGRSQVARGVAAAAALALLTAGALIWWAAAGGRSQRKDAVKPPEGTAAEQPPRAPASSVWPKLRTHTPPAPRKEATATKPVEQDVRPPVEKIPIASGPPPTRWLRRVELVDEDKPLDRLPVRGRIKKVGDKHDEPLIKALTDDERKEMGLPPPPDDLTEPCQVKVTLEPRGPGSPQGDTLVFAAAKPGYWIATILTLEDEDRVGVAVMVRKPGEIRENVLAIGTIQEIKEAPLGSVVIRFTAPQGSIKCKDSRKTTTFIEPTRYELLRKGEGEVAETAAACLHGRLARPAEAAETEPTPGPKAAETPGFPGARKGPASAPKAPRPEEAGVMTFTDLDVEAEAKYTYRIRSMLIPKEDGENRGEEYGPPREYRTLTRFSFAYVGGDASRANIIVFIGPRSAPWQGPCRGKLFERIPIGGWVGDMPKEFRPSTPAEAPEGEEPASSRFVTRLVLVAIEQDVLRPVEYIVRQPLSPAAMGLLRYKETVAYRESLDRRAIILDTKNNKLFYLWQDRQATPPEAPGKKGPTKWK